MNSPFLDIPKLEDPNADGPGWVVRRNYEGKILRPLIKCQCGKLCSIDLHHVHADGRVTASFYHSPESQFTDGGRTYGHTPGCGWHVFLRLVDYDCGDFLPNPEGV